VNLDSLQIETPRLLLRVPRLDDLDAWSAMMADEQARSSSAAWRRAK
jgi:RimJ/RimL family protein N-acetyltransferase